MKKPTIKALLSFGDGSMCTWDSCLIQDNSDETDDRIGTVTPIDRHHTVVYGPEPCKPVTKVSLSISTLSKLSN